MLYASVGALGLAVVLALALWGGSADAAKTTLDRTIKVQKSGAFPNLKAGPGESHEVRRGGFSPAKKNRARNRRSIAYFGQLTDPQVADEMSPLRVEKTDPIGGDFTAAWRPQEAFGTYVLDHIARSVNANKRSPVRTSRGRADLGFAILTGD